MPIRPLARVLALLAACCLCPSAAAQESIYLFVNGIAGGSQDEAHGGWIDVSGLSHGLSGPVGPGAPDFTEISVLKATNFDSPQLHLLGLQSANLSAVKIEVCRVIGAAEQASCYYLLELGGVVITGVDVSANACIGGGGGCGGCASRDCSGHHLTP